MNIRGLAEYLNLSIGTVSRALNGKRYVDPETRKRVLEAAAQFGYSPNLAGRSLRQGTSGMVAMMVPIIADVDLASTIFLGVLEGLRRYFTAQEIDLLVLLCETDITRDLAYLRRVVERGLVDGLVIADIQQFDPRIDYLLERRLPFVSFGRSETPGDYAWIDFDLIQAARDGTKRLVDLGHKDIALCVPDNHINYSYLVENAYRETLEANGIAVDPALGFRFDTTDEDGRGLAAAILSAPRRPSAILLSNAKTAIGLYQGLAEAGVVPGRDIAILAVIPESQRTLAPPLTGFDSNLRALGERLGEALLREMRRPGDPRVQELWPMHLVPGATDLPPN